MPSRKYSYERYVALATQAQEQGDKNYCVPMIYSLLVECPVSTASTILGRRKRRCTSVLPLIDALDDAGYNVKYLQGKRGRGMTRNMPNKLPTGKYILVSNTHVALMVDGVILDWSAKDGTTNKRITAVYKVTKRRAS